MSVLKRFRKTSDCEAVNLARAIAAEVHDLTANKNYFPKSHTFTTTIRLIEIADDIADYTYLANEVYVRKNSQEDLNLRTGYQTKAKLKCKLLINRLEITALHLPVKTNRVEDIVRCLVREIDLISKWRESDIKRFKNT